MNDRNYFDYTDKLCFLAEWFENETAFHKNFIVNFYPLDETVELYDRDLNRIYLRRATCDGVKMKDMFVGNTIRIYGKQLTIKDYADCRTKKFIGKSKEHTIAVIKPSAMDKLGEVITQIESNQFQICRMRMSLLSRKEGLEFYKSEKGDAFLPFKIEHLASGNIVAAELVGEDAIARFQRVVGPQDPEEARIKEPTSLRAMYGKMRDTNGFHASRSEEQALENACFFFPQGIDKKTPSATCTLRNSTCCIIKPHAIAEGKLGPIISYIMDSKFKITALQMIYLTSTTADEFLEVYKGVVSDFHALLMSFLDGPCVALEISGKDDDGDINVHQEFRQFAGPFDSDVARQIRPQTIRGVFGVDKYKNAIHCTDLPEDTTLELEYFFKILEN